MKKILILQLVIIFSLSAFSQNEEFIYTNGEHEVNVEVKFLSKPVETRIDNAYVNQTTAITVISELAYYVNIQEGSKINVPKALEKNLGGVAKITKEYKIDKHKIVEFDFEAQGAYAKYKVIYYKKGFVWLSVTGNSYPQDKDVLPFFNSIKLDGLPCF